MKSFVATISCVVCIVFAAGPAFAQPAGEYYPSLSFSTVLNGVTIVYTGGEFRLDRIQGTFINPGAKGYTMLRSADGTELYRMDWEAEAIKTPYTLLQIHTTTDLATNEPIFGFIPLNKEGDYVLDFYLESGQFYTFPFSVKTVQPVNAFSGQTWWVMEGDWQKWGYLYIPDNNSEQNLYWKMWLRRVSQNDKSELHEEHDIKVKITGPKGVVCVSRDATRDLGPTMTRWEFDMVYPSKGTKETSWNEYFKAKHLLATDGKYTLTVTMDGNLYGEWPFEVKGGKLQYKGRSDRATAEHTRFVEGGLDAWWYEKK